MKRILICLLCAALLPLHAAAVETRRDGDVPIAAPSAILVECSTGAVLYEKNADERLPPASVTKVMTMLFVAADGVARFGTLQIFARLLRSLVSGSLKEIEFARDLV